MKVTTKMMLFIVLTAGLLFSCSVIAGAEVLLGVSGETGTLNFSANSTSATPSVIILNGDLNLFLIHINAEYGTAQMGQNSLYIGAVKAGWELGPKILKVKLFGAYRVYGYTALANANVIGGLVANLGVESKIGKLTMYGDTDIPLMIQYTNGAQPPENGASLTYLNLGASYALLPLIDVFANYRSMTGDSSAMDLSMNGITVGVRVSF